MSKIENFKKFKKEFWEKNKDVIDISIWLKDIDQNYVDEEEFIEAVCKYLAGGNCNFLVIPDGLYETENCKFSVHKGMLDYSLEREVLNHYIKCSYFGGLLHGNYYEYKDPEHKILLRIKVYKDGELIEERENKWRHLNFPHGKVFFKVEEMNVSDKYTEYKLWYFHDWIWQPVPKINEHDNIIEDSVFYDKDNVYEFMMMYKNPDKFIEYLNTVYSYA